MKISLSIICTLFFLSSNVSAQSYRFLYYLDADLLSTSNSNAIYIGKGKIDGSLCLVDCFDKNTNNIVMSVHFSDSLLTTIHGYYKDFYNNGKLKQQGNFINGDRDGEWDVWDSLGSKTNTVLFNRGTVKSTIEYNYYKGKVSSKVEKDSSGIQMKVLAYDSKGKVLEDDKIYNRVDAIPVFIGKLTFQEYLLQNVNGKLPYSNGARGSMYLVTINFVVDANGNVKDVVKESVNGYGMEEEAIRAIKNSPKWIPATINGNNVSYRMKEIVPF